jgi:hypothetical protein
VKHRIARWAADKEFVEVRDLFSVTTFLHLGNFLAADDGGDLVVRLSPDDEAQARKLDGARPWRTGAPGTPVYTLVPATRVASDDELHRWLDAALAYTSTLEPKERLITKRVLRPSWMDTTDE